MIGFARAGSDRVYIVIDVRFAILSRLRLAFWFSFFKPTCNTDKVRRLRYADNIGRRQPQKFVNEVHLNECDYSVYTLPLDYRYVYKVQRYESSNP